MSKLGFTEAISLSSRKSPKNPKYIRKQIYASHKSLSLVFTTKLGFISCHLPTAVSFLDSLILIN